MAEVEARRLDNEFSSGDYERLAVEMEALFAYGLAGNAAVVADQIAKALHQAARLQRQAELVSADEAVTP